MAHGQITIPNGWHLDGKAISLLICPHHNRDDLWSICAHCTIDHQAEIDTVFAALECGCLQRRFPGDPIPDYGVSMLERCEVIVIGEQRQLPNDEIAKCVGLSALSVNYITHDAEVFGPGQWTTIAQWVTYPLV